MRPGLFASSPLLTPGPGLNSSTLTASELVRQTSYSANKFTPKNVLFWPDANSKFVFDSFLVMGLFLLVEEIQNASSDANGHKWFET